MTGASQAARARPSDDQIIEVLREYGAGGRATYVVRNCLQMAGFRVETPWVLRQLKRLEREARVTRVPGPWAVMITWTTLNAKGAENV